MCVLDASYHSGLEMHLCCVDVAGASAAPQKVAPGCVPSSLCLQDTSQGAVSITLGVLSLSILCVLVLLGWLFAS
jgi:hypothetical protein